jgi:hypothetical protein
LGRIIFTGESTFISTDDKLVLVYRLQGGGGATDAVLIQWWGWISHEGAGIVIQDSITVVFYKFV